MRNVRYCSTATQPIVEYSSPVWDCLYRGKKIAQVEMVQKRSARWVLSRCNRQDSVSDMLNCIGLEDIAISQNNCLPVCALLVQKQLTYGGNAELHPVAYSSTQSSRHAYKS